MYHNTTESTGEELKTYRKKALTQEQKILAFLLDDPTRPISPKAAWEWVFGGAAGTTPIGSVRRAITDLTDAGHLVQTTAMVPGLYGRKEHVWRLADKYLQGELF